MGSSLESKRLYTPDGPRASSLCPLSQGDTHLGFYYFGFWGVFLKGDIFVLFWVGIVFCFVCCLFCFDSAAWLVGS